MDAMKLVLCCALSFFLMGCEALEPVSLDPVWERQAYVDKTSVRSPLGAYTLLRNKEVTCVVRFFDLQGIRDRESGEGLATAAKYECICQPNNEAPKFGKNAVINKGRVNGVFFRTYPANGAAVYKDVKDQLVVLGKSHMAVVWMTPNGLTFYSAKPGNPFLVDNDLELAPTAFRGMDEIDLDSKNIQWFKASDGRKGMRISMEYLPY